MNDLVTYHFLFTAEVVTPLELDEHCGSALRGNLYEAVWKRFCTNKDAPTCAGCPLHTLCPVSSLVAPLRDENQGARDVPRPYIILPPLGERRLYRPGEELLFGLTLFGNIIQLLPYLMLSINALEMAGLGRRIKERNGQRGRFTIKYIETYNPFDGQRQRVYAKGKPIVNAPTLAITSTDVEARAASYSTERITLNFLTPTRIIYREHLLHQPQFLPLIQRLIERLEALEVTYAGGQRASKEEYQRLQILAESIQCSNDATRWEDVDSYSRRLKRSTPIGGLIGRATFSGDLTPFRELLAWGELIHVGKSCVKGDGWYKVEP